MTRGGSKGKKTSSKPVKANQSTSSKVKLTIPARPAVTQSIASAEPSKDSLVAQAELVPATALDVEPTKVQSPSPPKGPQSKDDIRVILMPPSRLETPPPPSMEAKKCLFSEFFSIDDSEEERERSLSPVPKQKISKAKARAAGKAELDEKLQRIVLLIPQSSGASDRRKTLTQSTDYEDALSTIHETIGCEEVKRKPQLSYKLTDASQKSSPVGLECRDDWMGLCEEVIDRQKKKKMSIPYMKSLRARSNEGKPVASSRGPGGKAKLGKKMVLMDLDNDDGDDGGDESMMEKEARFAEQLNKVLTSCQLCGNEKYCRISRNGEHVNLSFQQRRGWAVALAHGTHGVTLQTPPRNELFAQFHGLGTKKADAQPTASILPQVFGMAPMNPYMFSAPWLPPLPMPPTYGNPMPAGFQVPVTPQSAPVVTAGPPSHRSLRHELLSSDPPEDAFLEPYPEIQKFLEKLANENPKRRLEEYIGTFEKNDYYTVDDIQSITLERLLAVPFNMTQGNAEFLLREIAREMKRVSRIRDMDRTRKRARYY